MRWRPSDGCGIRTEHLSDVVVVLHLRVVRAHILDGEGCARRECAGLEAVHHAGSQLFELVDRARPRHPKTFGVRGDDVGRITAVDDDAVHLISGAQVLAQQADPDLRNGEGIRRVDT